MSKPDPINEPKRGVGFQSMTHATEDRFLPGPTHFLGIGIDTYPHWAPLNNAVRDVKAIRQLLTDRYQLISHEANLLLNEQATRSKILQALKTVMQQAKEDESVLIYFAGHGHLDPHSKRGFLVPFDGAPNDDSTYIRNTTLRDYFQDCHARHILFLSDACFSGTLLVERRSKGAQLAAQQLERLNSRWVICSGRHNQEVLDGPPGGHSPFAQAVLNALGKVDQPAITSAFLGQWVQEETQHNYNEQLPDYGPVYGVGDQRGQFVFWPQGSTVERQLSDETPPSPPPPAANQPDGPISFEPFIQVVQEMIAEDRQKEVLRYMRQALVNKSNLQNDLIGLNARLARLTRRENGGLITESRAELERNRINAALQSLLEDLRKDELRPDAPWPE